MGLGGDEEWVKLCLVPSKTGVSNMHLSFGYYFVVICFIVQFLKIWKK